MIKIVRTDSDDPHFRELVVLLDRDLKTRDGDDHDFYAQYNKLDAIQHTIVAYINDVPAGCGAIKFYSNDIAEVKRMFVHPAHRRQGIAAGILASLESWARELGYSHCILETGKLQPEAIALYRRSGYSIIPNYGQYEQVENSVCMKKQLAEI